MSSLRELQQDFLHAIFGSDIGPISSQIIQAGLPSESRALIYKTNVFANLRESLRSVYPVIERLVGEEFFNHAADEYIRQHRSRSGDIQQYGAEFGAFLSRFPGARELAYLPDTARLEWAYNRVFHAADHAPLSVQRLTHVNPESYANLRFRVHPASALLESNYPVHRIWEVNQPEYQGDQSVDLSQGGAKLLLIRRGYTIEMHPMSTAEFTLLRGLADRKTIAQALEEVLRIEPAFNLDFFLREHVTRGTLVDLLESYHVSY